MLASLLVGTILEDAKKVFPLGHFLSAASAVYKIDQFNFPKKAQKRVFYSISLPYGLNPALVGH